MNLIEAEPLCKRDYMKSVHKIMREDLNGTSQQKKGCDFDSTPTTTPSSPTLECRHEMERMIDEDSDADEDLFQQTLSCLQSNRMEPNNQYLGCLNEIEVGEDYQSYPFNSIYENKQSPFQNYRQFQHFDQESYFSLDKLSAELAPTDDRQAKGTITCEEQFDSRESLRSQILFEQEKIQLYKKVYQGTKDDTMELCINFKTLLISYFREFQLVNELLPAEISHVNEFSARSPSLKSLAAFYQDKPGNQGIRSMCLQLFSASECIQRIMRSRCQMATKLQMIKFIEKMRINLFGQGHITRWKDVIKRQP